MEFSGFTIIYENCTLSYSSDYNNLLFVKFNDKVYIKIFGYISKSIILTFEELMKNKYLKTYYELSLVAIGKPNIDKDYYESDDPNYVLNINEINTHMYVDTMYIVEDALTHTKKAKKGNCYYSLDIEKIKNLNVSNDDEIEEFFTKYNKLYGFNKENFEEKKTLYTTLVNKL